MIEAGQTTVSAAGVDDPTRRVGEIVREVVLGGIAGVLGGVLVVGIGGRLFMRIVAAIDPTSLGVLTSNGNRIGEVTLEGTAFLVLIGGPLFGALGGVVWVSVAPWIPGTGARRALTGAVIAVALGAFFVIRSDESDFSALEPAAVVIGLLVLLIASFGFAIALIDQYLGRHVPAAESTPAWAMVAYSIILAVGLLVSPLAIGPYFTGDPSPFRRPVEVGLALLVVGVATLVWWTIRTRDGRVERPGALIVVGRGALVIGVVLGAAKLVGEISAILATPGVR